MCPDYGKNLLFAQECKYYILLYSHFTVILELYAKKCLYNGVIVPRALYGAEAWGMRSDERKK